MKDIKYLGAYFIPFFVFLGFYLGGIFAYSGVLFSFVLVPVLEAIFPISKANTPEEEIENKLANHFFDVMLYLNVVWVYSALAYFFYLFSQTEIETWVLIGHIVSLGTLLGANGINVAHELGHRFNHFEQFLAGALLLPSFYTHFTIEHNLGHHKHVATPEDPATARLNETVYAFWYRSTVYSYLNAWKLQKRKLSRDNKPFISLYNGMLRNTLLQLTYLATIAYFISLSGMFIAIAIGVFSFLLLETINYIEHYGLLRKKKNNGQYERVKPIHSWNSNHAMGRIVLYELTRHSDHHYKAAKKYQILDYQEEANQLPFGYPTAMLTSLIPPLWFKIMNSRIQEN